MKLQAGQVAVVTGAAHGLGRAVARALGARGVKLALVDRDAEALGAVCAELGALELVLDLRDRAALLSIPERVLARFGAVDLLVCCAGVSLGGELGAVRAEDLDWIVDINLVAPMQLCRALLPALRARPRAHILTVASTFAMLPSPGKTGYCASKSGLLGFTEALRAELRGTGVGVGCAVPGAVRTDIVRRGRVATEALRQREHEVLQQRGQDPARVAERLLRAVERDEGRILLGADAALVSLAARLAGGRLAAWMGDNAHRLPWVGG